MTIDLSHLSVEQEFGVYRTVDARRDVANTIHQGTADIGVDDIARRLYYASGEVEIPAAMVAEMTAIVKRSGLVAYVKRAVLDALGKEVAR